jgi:hypothetical protein
MTSIPINISEDGKAALYTRQSNNSIPPGKLMLMVYSAEDALPLAVDIVD